MNKKLAKIVKPLIAVAMSSMFALSFTACGGNGHTHVDNNGDRYCDDCHANLGGGQIDDGGETEKTEISLDMKAVTLNLGGTQQLTATVTPAGKQVTWSSDAPAVATVSGSGLVTAHAAGTANVTATADGKSVTCKVTVNNSTAAKVPVSSVAVAPAQLSLKKGQTQSVLVEVLPNNATNSAVTWSTDAKDVATVDSTGRITAVGKGTAHIIATADGVKGTCTVTVTEDSGSLPATTYTVTFISEGQQVDIQSVESGSVVTAPTVSLSGKYLMGWYDNQACTGNAYDFTTPITAEKTFYAKWGNVDASLSYSATYNEGAAFEWGDGNPANATVEYKLSNESAYTAVDSALIRGLQGGKARVDILGLKGGASYDFKITPSSGNEITVNQMAVTSYDRSGYAHFKYDDGVGAYNDDGTLKDNTLVIYVTDENKNTVSKGYVNGQEVDLTPYLWQGKAGIGWILNNRGYDSKASRANYGIQKLCFTYGAVDVRILGKVNAEVSASAADAPHSLIDGLTIYNSTENGGSNGDNGRMARITNAKNLTIEGVGTDACMYGWGVHFVSNDNLHEYEGAGKGFEVRNITFEHYPEDAVGMEGTQGTAVDSLGTITAGKSDAGADLISPVERCWIHNNVFKLGFCADPTESDKSEGDGSCDFKRGQYYTLSYNYFSDCHKTNLIGSSDDSVTFNVTMHHNWWHNVEARQPLARRANIHYYNNYVSGAVDYVISPRAYCYILAEGNYFYGCKNVAEVDTGIVKGCGNVYNGNYKDNAIKNVARDEAVDNSCKFIYRDIDYSRFDTNPEQFYYDAVNKKSDCLLQDAVSARKTVMTSAGVIGFGRKETNMNENTPEGALQISQDQTLTIDLNNISGSGIMGVAKGKGQVITFRLANRANVSVTCSGGVLADSEGRVYADQFTSYSGQLEAGIYFISCQSLFFEGDKLGGKNLKEVEVTALSFTSGVSDAEIVKGVMDKIDAIGTVALTEECKNKIDEAIAAYSSLQAGLRSQVTNYATLTEAVDTYDGLAAQQVIDLISAIGTVNENSGLKINSARTAYNKLTDGQQAKVTNYSTLLNAESEYENYKVAGLNKQIAALADPSTATTEDAIRDLLSQYKAVQGMYLELDSAKQSQVNNYSKVTSGIVALEAAVRPYDVKAMIAALPAADAITLGDATEVKEARTAYDALNASQKTVVGDITKLTDAEAKVLELASKTTVAIFARDDSDKPLPLPENVTASGNYKNGTTFTYDGVTYSDPMKMESSTTITIKLAVKSTVTVKFTGAMGHVVIDDCDRSCTGHTAGSDGILTLTLEAGTHTIKKGNGSNQICYLVIQAA